MVPLDQPSPRRVAKLLRRFDRLAARRRPALAQLCGAVTDAVIAEARVEYERLMPEMAALGGGIMNGALAGTYEYLAYAKVLRGRGYGAEQIGGFFADSFQALIDRVPTWLARLVYRVGRPFLAARLRREAVASQESDDPDAWHFDFAEGRSGGPDFGLDVKGCAVCALYTRHDASDVVPYLCALDDQMSVALGMGLQRSGTRAVGASCCDFRYTTGGPPKTLRSQYALPVVMTPEVNSSTE